MYVCICNGYRDWEIREVAESGIRCAVEAYFELGDGPCCGRCLSTAQSLIDGIHDNPCAERVAGPILERIAS
jgi:bacterioferritin-associated ferredoxin